MRPARPSSNAPSKVGFHFDFVSVLFSVFVSACVLSLDVSGLPSHVWFSISLRLFLLSCLETVFTPAVCQKW